MSVRRREFITLLAGVAAWPVAACTQQNDSLRALQMRILRLQAESAAAKIDQFIEEIARQIAWTTLLPWSTRTFDQRYSDAQQLLHQVPAITDVFEFDSTGREQLRLSRSAILDERLHPYQKEFAEAVANKIYYSPVHLRNESEPYMTLSLAGIGRNAGVSVAEVNLKFIWEVVSQIKVGQRGDAYLVDAQGHLIAHPDFSLVLRNTDMTRLPHVAAALAAVSAGAGAGPDSGVEQVQGAKDILGREVLTAYAPIAPLGWLVFVELPVQEAHAPLYLALERSFGPLLAGLILAFFGIAWLFSRSRRRVTIE